MHFTSFRDFCNHLVLDFREIGSAIPVSRISMKRGLRELWIISYVCIVLGIVPLAANANTPGTSALPEIQFTATVDKKQFFAGEPILVTLMVSNDANTAESVFLSGGASAAIDVSLTDANGIILIKGANLPQSGGFRTSESAMNLPPGQTMCRSFVLNQKCSTLHVQGNLTAVCTIKYYLGSEDRVVQQGIRQLRIAGPEHRKTISVNFEVLPYDEEKVRVILSEIAERSNRLLTSGKLMGPEEPEMATASIEMLACAEGSVAVPYQLDIVCEPEWGETIRLKALHSLERTANLEAARGVMAMVADHRLWFAMGNSDLILAVYTMRDKGSQAVREATEEFVKRYPRPPKIQIMN